MREKVTDIRNHRKFRGQRLRAVYRRAAGQTETRPRLDSLTDLFRVIFGIFWERPLQATFELLGIIFAARLLFHIIPFVLEGISNLSK